MLPTFKTLNFLNKNQVYHWLLFLLIIGLVLLKLEVMTLPFFWDEAWSYLPAIREMAAKGPSLLPGSINAEFYRGHPMLFYFLSSLWIKIFGYSMPIAHLFPLLISIILLLSVYFITYSWTTSYFTAFVATLLLFIQPMFLAQSTFLLCEVLLGLFFLWAFWFYFKSKWIGFGIFMVAALLTKESAYCLVPAFLLIALLQWILKEINTQFFLKLTAYILLLFIIGFSFFIIQKIKLGWFFFPLHTSMIDLNEIGSKFKLSIKILFIEQGRGYIFLLTFITTLLSLNFIKSEFTKFKYILIFSLLLFVFGNMLFASINFLSTRYLLPVLPFLIIVCAVLIGSYNKLQFKFIIIPIITFIGFIGIKKSIEQPFYSDVELNYSNMLKSQVEFITYIEANPPTERIYAPFLIYINLCNEQAGFVKKGFKNLNAEVNDSTNMYYIKTSIETCKELEDMIQNKKVQLVKGFENNKAKVEFYKRKN